MCVIFSLSNIFLPVVLKHLKNSSFYMLTYLENAKNILYQMDTLNSRENK